MYDKFEYYTFKITATLPVGQCVYVWFVIFEILFFSGCRSYVFRPQTREAREAGGHQTSGVDMYVTQERVILLDSQVHNAAILIPTILFNPKMS